ncbi:MAG: hypothetical protein U5M23_01365 [Marinagarivorans sp.]|nr:hypothetical protein [Marinagarivorans sp.]
MLNKLYGAGIILALITAAWLRYDYVVSEFAESKLKIKTYLENIDKLNSAISEKEKKQKEQQQRNIELLLGKNKYENDLKALRACIADKSCVPRVRIKTSCDVMPETAPTSAGVDASATGFAEVDAGAYYNLVEAHKKVIWMIEGLQKELNARQ